MYTESAVIRDEIGLHARPASQFVKLARTFESDIMIKKEGADTAANGKSITSILLMGATKDTFVQITADGSDEAQACRALRELLECE